MHSIVLQTGWWWKGMFRSSEIHLSPGWGSTNFPLPNPRLTPWAVHSYAASRLLRATPFHFFGAVWLRHRLVRAYVGIARARCTLRLGVERLRTARTGSTLFHLFGEALTKIAAGATRISVAPARAGRPRLHLVFPELGLSSPYLFRPHPLAEMLQRSASDVTTSGMY